MIKLAGLNRANEGEGDTEVHKKCEGKFAGFCNKHVGKNWGCRLCVGVVSGLERWLQAERRKEGYWRAGKRKNQRRVKNKNEDQPEKGEKKKRGNRKRGDERRLIKENGRCQECRRWQRTWIEETDYRARRTSSTVPGIFKKEDATVPVLDGRERGGEEGKRS